MKRKVRSIIRQIFGIQTRLQEIDAHAETKRKAAYFSSIFLVLSFTILFTTVGAPFLPFVSFILTRPGIKPKKKVVLNERLGHTWTYESFGATEGRQQTLHTKRGVLGMSIEAYLLLYKKCVESKVKTNKEKSNRRRHDAANPQNFWDLEKENHEAMKHYCRSR
jgi:hypothetical protein